MKRGEFPFRRFGGTWRLLASLAVLPAVVGAIVLAASALSDDSLVPAEIAASARGSGVMWCSQGVVDHGDKSLIERLMSGGTFRCTAWRMRGRQTDSTTGAVDWPSSPKR